MLVESRGDRCQDLYRGRQACLPRFCLQAVPASSAFPVPREGEVRLHLPLPEGRSPSSLRSPSKSKPPWAQLLLYKSPQHPPNLRSAYPSPLFSLGLVLRFGFLPASRFCLSFSRLLTFVSVWSRTPTKKQPRPPSQKLNLNLNTSAP